MFTFESRAMVEMGKATEIISDCIPININAKISETRRSASIYIFLSSGNTMLKMKHRYLL